MSPKVKEGSKSWKGKMVKGLKRWGHHGPHSPTETEMVGCTIGVPLELCPPSSNNEVFFMISLHRTSSTKQFVFRLAIDKYFLAFY